jgi:hypothetical protein
MQDEKRAASKKPAPPLSNYERTITKKIKEELTTVKEAEVVDEWRRKYVYGRSLCDPAKVKNLGTQMYKLHEYYLRFCAQHQSE